MTVKATPESMTTYHVALCKAMSVTSVLYDLIMDIQACAPDTVADLDMSITNSRHHILGLEDGLAEMLEQEV